MSSNVSPSVQVLPARSSSPIVEFLPCPAQPSTVPSVHWHVSKFPPYSTTSLVVSKLLKVSLARWSQKREYFRGRDPN